ncbi:MAG: hypothetical protein AAF589_09495 [Planctomycetota bacterium]
MPITVTCPGCLKRFSVGDQHAGKQGPCPQCKELITIPKLDEQVVIHAPDDGAPKDAKGRSVLKTTKTKDGKFSPIVAGGVGLVSLLVLVVALLARFGTAPAGLPVLATGAVVLGPLLAWAGYGFLRDSELEPYTGNALLVRTLVCGLGFAAGWGAYALLCYQLGGEWPIGSLAPFQMLIAAAGAVAAGTLASYASLDLEPTIAGVHCALYLLVTILLRWIMALPPVPGLGD